MNNIESRVLEMKFDNEQFESAVATTMSTLDKFKEKLKFDDVGKGIHKLGQATAGYEYTLNDVGTSLSNLERYFASCGTIGAKIFDTLTTKAANFVTNGIGKVISSITEGGMSRAMNLEQAKFQMEGILGDAKKVHRVIYDDILPELQGTPYSLDQAAVVIGQLTASGKTSSEQIKRAIRGMAGLAAMTGHELSDVGRIYTKIAGNGVMMAEELNQLSGYGVNAAADLAKFYKGVEKGSYQSTQKTLEDMAKIKEAYGEFTEGTIREAASKRMISYGSMAAAMDALYGAHAQKSIQMYTGALEDLKAAFARIGAEPATLKLNFLRDAFNALVPAVDAVNAVIKPFWNTARSTDKVFKKVPEYVKPFTGSLSKKVQEFGWSFQKLFVKLDKNNEIVRVTRDNYKKLGLEMRDLGKGTVEFYKKLKKGGEQVYDEKQAMMNPKMLKTITNLTKGMVNIFKALGKTISAIGKGAKKALPKVTFDQIVSLSKHIKNFTKSLIPSERMFWKIRNAAQAAFTPINILIKASIGVVKLLSRVLSALSPVFKPVLDNLLKIIDRFNIFIIDLGYAAGHIGAAISNFINFGATILTVIADVFKLNKVVDSIQNGFRKFTTGIVDFFANAGNKIVAWSKKLEAFSRDLNLDETTEKVERITTAVKDFFDVALHLDELKQGLHDFWEPIKEFLDSHDIWGTIIDKVKDAISKFSDFVGLHTDVDTLTTSLENLQEKIGNFTASPASKIKTWLGTIGKSIADFLNSLSEAGYVMPWLRKNFKIVDFVYKLGQPIKRMFEPLGQSIVDFVKSFAGIETTGELVDKAGQMIKNGFEKIVAAVGILFNKDTGDKLKNVKDTLFDKTFIDNLDKIGSKFETAIKPFSDAFNEFHTGISKYLDTLDPQSVKKVLVSLILLGVSISYMSTLHSAKKTIQGFLIILDKFAELPKAMSLVAAGFKDVLTAFKGIAKAVTGIAYILAIAASLVIFAAALKILSTIDVGHLIIGTAILGTCVLAIVFLLKFISKLDLSETGNKALKLGIAIVSVAAALMLLALAIKLMVDVGVSNSWQDVGKAVGLIAALILILGAFGVALSNRAISKNISNLGWTMVGIGSGMKLIAEACRMFANEMDPDAMQRGVSAITQIMIMFAVFAAANWHGAAVGKAAFGIIGIAVALALIARTMNYIVKNLKTKQIDAVTSAISQIIMFFSLFAFMVGLASKLGAGSLTATAMVLSMALFVKVLADSMILMASLIEGGKLDKVTEVMQAFMAMMAAMMVVSALGGMGTAAGPAAVAALAVALAGLAYSVYLLGTMPLLDVIQGFNRLWIVLLGLIGVVIGVGLAMDAFTKMVSAKDALGILAVAAGMLMFVVVIRMLADLPIDALIVSMVGLIGIIFSVGVVLSTLGDIAGPGLLIVAAAFALLGAAALFVGAGLMLVTLALSALIPLIIALGGVDTDALAQGLNVLLMVAEGLKEVFYNIADGVMYFGLAMTLTAVSLILFAVSITLTSLSLIIAAAAVLILAGAFAVLGSVLDAFVPQIKDSVLGTLGNLITKVGEFFGNLREEKDNLTKELEATKETNAKAAEESTNAAKEKYEEGTQDIQNSLIGRYLNNGSVLDAAEESGEEEGKANILGFTNVISSEGPGEIAGAFDGIVSEDTFMGMFDATDVSAAKIPKIFGTSVSNNAEYAEEGVAEMANKAADGASDADESFVKSAQNSAKKWADALEESEEPKSKAKSMAKAAADVTDNSDIGWSSAGKNAALGFAQGIATGTPIWVTSAARAMARAAINAAKEELDQNSPSKVFIKIGKSVGEGFAMGIDAMTSNVIKTTEDLMDTSIGSARLAAAAINAATNIDEFTPTITPVVDLSKVDESVNQMGNMFNTAFGVTTPFGAMNAAYAASSFADSRNQNARTDSINKLANKIDAMTETMNSRSLNVYNTIDGASDPEMFADNLVRSFRLNARTV